MKSHQINIIGSVLQIAIGIFYLKEGIESVFLTILPLLFGMITLPMQQSLQHGLKSAFRVIFIVSLIAFVTYAYGSYKFYVSQNFQFLKTTLALSILVFINASIALIKAK